MEKNGNKNYIKNVPKYLCKLCDFKCFVKSDMSRHIMTLKHQNYVNGNKMETKNTYICKKCNKIYRSRVGLWKHNKTCNENNSNDEIEYEIEDESEDVSLKNLVLNLAIQKGCYNLIEVTNIVNALTFLNNESNGESTDNK